MIKITIFTLIALILVLFLRQYRPEYSLIAAVAAGAIIIIFLLLEVANPLLELFGLLTSYGIEKELTAYLLKALGICIITKFATELCLDFGQSSLSGKVEMAGKVSILIISLPIIKSILNAGLSLL